MKYIKYFFLTFFLTFIGCGISTQLIYPTNDNFKKYGIPDSVNGKAVLYAEIKKDYTSKTTSLGLITTGTAMIVYYASVEKDINKLPNNLKSYASSNHEAFIYGGVLTTFIGVLGIFQEFDVNTSLVMQDGTKVGYKNLNSIVSWEDASGIPYDVEYYMKTYPTPKYTKIKYIPTNTVFNVIITGETDYLYIFKYLDDKPNIKRSVKKELVQVIPQDDTKVISP